MKLLFFSPWSHGGGLARRHRESQVLLFLVVLLAVAVPQVGPQSDPSPAPLLRVLEAGALHSVFIRRLVRPVVPYVVIDDVDPIKSGLVGRAPLSF